MESITVKIGRRRRICERVRETDVDGDAVGSGVETGRLDSARIGVQRDDRRESELGGDDRENSRATADVHDARRLEL